MTIVVPGRGLSPIELEQRFNALLVAYGRPLSRLAGSYARDAAERDDLFQEIAIAIWRALPGFRGDCSERTFVFRIAHNRGISHLAQRRLPVADLSEDVELPDVRPTPEQALSRDQQERNLFEAIQHLPLGHRQVLTLALEGMAYAEIAEVLGITETNVGVRLTRAREMLRKLVM